MLLEVVVDVVVSGVDVDVSSVDTCASASLIRDPTSISSPVWNLVISTCSSKFSSLNPAISSLKASISSCIKSKLIYSPLV